MILLPGSLRSRQRVCTVLAASIACGLTACAEEGSPGAGGGGAAGSDASAVDSAPTTDGAGVERDASASDGSAGSGGTAGTGGSAGSGGSPLLEGGSGAPGADGSPPAPGDVIWARVFGDGAQQEAAAIAADSKRDIYLAGVLRGSADFGGGTLVSAGGGDVFVAKLDKMGNHLASYRFGDGEEQAALGVAVGGGDDVVLAGFFRGSIDLGGGSLAAAGASADAFVAKLDPSGAHLWSHRYGGASGDEAARAVAADASGNVIVAGEYQGALDLGGSPLPASAGTAVFVAGLAPGGGHAWSRGFGGVVAADRAEVAAVSVVGSSGDVVVAGSFQGTIDPGSGVLASAGGWDAFVVRLGSDGATKWARRFGDADEQRIGGAAVDASGNAFVAGSFRGVLDLGCGTRSASGQDVFVGKLGPDGECLLDRRFGDAADQAAHGLGVDGAGQVLVAGDFAGTMGFGTGVLSAQGGRDVFLAKLDPFLNAVFAGGYGPAGDQSATAVAADPATFVLAAGSAAGSLDLGQGPVAAAGRSAWLACFNP